MSNTHFTAATSPLYVNNFIGTTPSETSERLLQGLAALSELNFATSLSTDAALGVWHIVESLRMAAHHLVMELHDPSDPDPVEVDFSDDEAARIKDHAKASGCTPAEAVRKLALNEFAARLRRGDPEAVEADASLKAVADRMNCTVDEAAHYAVERGLNAD